MKTATETSKTATIRQLEKLRQEKTRMSGEARPVLKCAANVLVPVVQCNTTQVVVMIVSSGTCSDKALITK